MKKKIIVIDSLSRSGTTMLCSIFNSNYNSVCYRGMFHEPLAIIGCSKDWPNFLLSLDLQDKDINVLENNKLFNAFYNIVINYPKFENILYDFLRSLKLYNNRTLSINKLLKNSLDMLERHQQYQFFKKSTHLKKIFNEFFYLNENNKITIKDLDNFYFHVLKLHKKENLVWRWNNGIFYFNHWIQRKSHFWISIIRNPIDSAISRNKIWNISYENSAKMTKDYFKKANQLITNSKFNYIYYEDLINQPHNILKELSDNLEIKKGLSSENLMNQNNKPYSAELSTLGHNIRLKGVKMNYINPNIKKYSSKEREKVKNIFLKQNIFENQLLQRYLDV